MARRKRKKRGNFWAARSAATEEKEEEEREQGKGEEGGKGSEGEEEEGEGRVPHLRTIFWRKTLPKTDQKNPPVRAENFWGRKMRWEEIFGCSGREETNSA